MSVELRASPRVTATLPVVLVLGGERPCRLEGVTIDLARGGCRVRLPRDVVEELDGLEGTGRGVVAIHHAGILATRPVQSLHPEESGEVRVAFAVSRGGPDAWDALLLTLTPAG